MTSNNNTIGSSYFHHSHTLSAANTNPEVSPLRNTPSHLKSGSLIPTVNSTSPLSKKASTKSLNNK